MGIFTSGVFFVTMSSKKMGEEKMDTIEQFVKNNQKLYIDLIKTITSIPAPSHKEEKRVKFLLDYLHQLGYVNTFADEEKNVIIELCESEAENIHLYTAHIDTVFPDEEEIAVSETEDKLCGPGIGDDTANVAALLMFLTYLKQTGITTSQNLVIALNSCEEGLGNLDGAKALWKRYGNRITQHISFDGGYHWLVNRAVGSYRYEITFQTKGGHSYGDFGNANAIVYASEMIKGLYELSTRDLPGKTTYNVGMIQGGTSVNTIAQEASFLYEFRSDQEVSLYEMKKRAETKISEVLQVERQKVVLVNDAVIESSNAHVRIKLLGQRPGMGEVSKEKLMQLTDKARQIIFDETGVLPQEESGSTDCNVFLVNRIPSICFGVYEGEGEHTREEFIWKKSLEPGLRMAFRFLMEEYNDK